MISKIESFCSSYLNGITEIKAYTNQSYGKTALAALKVFTYIASLAVLPVVALGVRYVCRKISAPVAVPDPVIPQNPPGGQTPVNQQPLPVEQRPFALSTLPVVPSQLPKPFDPLSSKEGDEKVSAAENNTLHTRLRHLHVSNLVKDIQRFNPSAGLITMITFKINGRDKEVNLSSIKACNINGIKVTDPSLVDHFEGLDDDGSKIEISLSTMAQGYTSTNYSDESQPTSIIKKPCILDLIQELNRLQNITANASNTLTTRVNFLLNDNQTYTLSSIVAYDSTNQICSRPMLVSYFRGLNEKDNIDIKIFASDIDDVTFETFASKPLLDPNESFPVVPVAPNPLNTQPQVTVPLPPPVPFPELTPVRTNNISVFGVVEHLKAIKESVSGGLVHEKTKVYIIMKDGTQYKLSYVVPLNSNEKVDYEKLNCFYFNGVDETNGISHINLEDPSAWDRIEISVADIASARVSTEQDWRQELNLQI